MLTQTPPTILWGSDSLAALASPDTSWLWHGFLARGAITLLTSQWKSGKTTLVSVLLSKLQGGGELAGLALTPACALVLSEESPDHWARRNARLRFGPNIGWICRPFTGRPSIDAWNDLVDHIAAVARDRNMRLLVIDPLASFMAGGSENDPAAVLATLHPLQRLTALGLAVLVLHHPRKGDVRAGQAARGSGTLSGTADILIEMRYDGRITRSGRRRRLQAFSRFDESPSDLVIELTADGDHYISHGSFENHDFSRHWPYLESLLETAKNKLTRNDIFEMWYRLPRPSLTTINGYLETAIDKGLLKKDGKGHRTNPFRYWIAAREAFWRQDALSLLHNPELIESESVALVAPPVDNADTGRVAS
jgi:hypothetical protein